MQKRVNISFKSFIWRVSTLHVITYLFMGIIASTLFGYKELFKTNGLELLMRPVDSPIVALGPSLNIIRGVILALVLWIIKDIFIQEKFRWLKLWIVLVGLTIISTSGPAPGSFEALIYTTIPVTTQLTGLPEVLLQTLLFSFLLVKWYKNPKKLWNKIIIPSLVIILLMSLGGFFLT